MATVYRAGGFRFVIFVNDHAPAHVHVFGDGEAKIDLVGDEPRLVWAYGMNKTDVRRAMKIAVEQQEGLLKKWREIHGGTDGSGY
jgi:hypothetical protein